MLPEGVVGRNIYRRQLAPTHFRYMTSRTRESIERVIVEQDDFIVGSYRDVEFDRRTTCFVTLAKQNFKLTVEQIEELDNKVINNYVAF